MALSAGTRLGTYEILAPLGAGGMGEVYRARDAKLGREVAIKVLPDEFSQDKERLARFEREARLLASLNHPNIATLHGFEESNDIRFLVMELVEGETLGERLARGPIPLDEALPLFGRIASGLHAAHEKGVIHRDLKPANIMITPDGVPKILDFGLAKAALAGEVSEESPTVTRQGTETGIILGTAAYMSPEQARGKSLDKRTDVWSFGCVLYEALTGRAVFLGETVSDTIAKILEREPDWRALPERTPVLVRSLLRRCLAKYPARRLHDMADARIEIEEASSDPAEATPSQATSRRNPVIALGALTVATMIVALWALTRSSAPEPKAVTRTVINLPEGRHLALEGTTAVALSPDGRYVAYFARNAGKTELYLRALDELEAKPIAGSEDGLMPFFSPDSQWLGFDARGAIMKVSVSGGAPVPFFEGSAHRGASWSERGVVLSPAGSAGLDFVTTDVGGMKPLTTLDRDRNEKSHRFPEVLPGGRAVLFTIGTTDIEFQDESSIAVLNLETGEQRVVLEGGMSARYSPSGHLVYARAGSLFAVPFDVDRLEVTGAPVAVIDSVSMSVASGNAEFGLSRDGALLYVPGGVEGVDRQIVWVDRDGRSELLIETTRAYAGLGFSPDGRFLAVWISGANDSVWVHDMARGTLTRLAHGSDNEGNLWTPQGDRLTFVSDRNGPYNLFWQPADGSGPAEPLATSELAQIPGSWTPDGNALVFSQGSDIWWLTLDGDRKPQPLVEADHLLSYPRLSSDGRWLAYVSDETGHDEVYLQAFPDLGRKHQVSSHGGFDPVWNPNGRELFFRWADAIYVVDVRSQGELELGTPRVLFEAPSALTTLAIRYRWNTYDITPDGRRFAMIVSSESETERTELVYVHNWAEELKRLVPTGN